MFPGWDYILKRLEARPAPRPQLDLQPAHPVDPEDAIAPLSGHPEEQPEEAPRAPYRRQRRERQLICPACAAPMALESMGSVEIDRCTACGGIFLDSGELALLRGETGASFARDQKEHRTLIYTPHGLE